MKSCHAKNSIKLALRTGALGAAALLAACSDAAELTGPERLSAFERTVLEGTALDALMDLFWVVDGSHGGSFPRLGFAFSLSAVHAGLLGSITVDAAQEPGLFDPYCDASILEGVQNCLRLQLHEDGDYDLQVYYTLPPDLTPRMQPHITYSGEAPVSTVRYEPQPLRVWEFQTTPAGELSEVSVQFDERFTVTSPGDGAIELTVDGTMVGALAQPQQVHASLAVAGLSACAQLRIEFDGVEDGTASGEIRCGGRLWADLRFEPGEPLEVAWRD